MSCCPETVGCDSAYAEKQAAREAEEKAMMERPFELNGVKLKIKDMFPDCWAAKEFVTKLNLLEKSAGGKNLMDTKVSSIMDGESDEGEEA